MRRGDLLQEASHDLPGNASDLRAEKARLVRVLLIATRRRRHLISMHATSRSSSPSQCLYIFSLLRALHFKLYIQASSSVALLCRRKKQQATSTLCSYNSDHGAKV